MGFPSDRTILTEADRPGAMLVLGHGAGAGMRHPFMERIAGMLAEQGVSTLRYEFPYMAEQRKRPDPPAVAQRCVREACERAREMKPELPLFAGGKSFGGRMTSQAASAGMLEAVQGIVFLGFPLHPPKRPGTERGAHLFDVGQPMLFLQGTRDDLADLELLRPICERLGDRATLHVIDGADHSFNVLKKSGRSHADVMQELARTTAEWIASVAAQPA